MIALKRSTNSMEIITKPDVYTNHLFTREDLLAPLCQGF